MEGVDDVVPVEMTHIEFFRRPRKGETQPVWNAVVERLKRLEG